MTTKTDGALLNISGNGQWQVPLAMQCLPALLLFGGMLFCNESPRWLARTDQWDKSTEVLSHVRKLPTHHPYVQAELVEMRKQLTEELASVGGSHSWWSLAKEMIAIPGNRKRAGISIFLMICQQMTGTNAVCGILETDFSWSLQEAKKEKHR